MIFKYRLSRDVWSLVIKSQTSSIIGKPIIPVYVSKIGLDLNLDIGVVEGTSGRVPKKLRIKTFNGARQNDLTFQLDKVNLLNQYLFQYDHRYRSIISIIHLLDLNYKTWKIVDIF